MVTMLPPGLRDHQAGRLLAGVQHSLDVHVQDSVEVLVAGLQDRVVVHDPGDRRQPAQAFAGGDGLAELGAVGDVEGVGAGGAAVRLDPGRRLVQALGVAVRAVRGGTRLGASRTAETRPMPPAAPVTKAVRPVRSCAVTTGM
jgi:hypothetical protein